MASEDIFSEITSELHQDQDISINNVEDEHEVYEETEDMTGGVDFGETRAATESSNVEEGDILPKSAQAIERELKLFQLPLTRIRNLMKLDPDLNLASHEATFLVARATELFIESLARESYRYTAQSKKKTIQKRDVDMAISAVDSLMFLDGAMNF